MAMKHGDYREATYGIENVNKNAVNQYL